LCAHLSIKPGEYKKRLIGFSKSSSFFESKTTLFLYKVTGDTAPIIPNLDDIALKYNGFHELIYHPL
jgi:hypothetical protein